jgi:LysM repeat protein
MNNPNPIGSLTPLAQASKGNRNVRIAVISIAALHGVFFAGLLFQGCGPRTTESAGKDADNSFLTPTNAGYASANVLTNSAYADLTNWPSYATQYGGTSTNLGVGGAGTSGVGGYSGATGAVAMGTVGGVIGAPGTVGGGGGLGAAGVGGAAGTEPVTEATDPSAAAFTTYKIKKGDTLGKIATAHGISIKSLTDANPGVDPKKLQIDKELKLPAAKQAALADAAAEGVTVYTVKKGDTLTGIARKFGVTVPEIRKANGLKTDSIMVDKKLRIPVAPKAEGTTTTGQG